MLKHYIRIAIRNLGRQKVLTVINISGLSIGLACFSLILLFAVNEFSYDRFRANAEHIFRVDEIYTRDDGSQSGEAGLYTPLGPAMKKEFPDVIEAVRRSPSGQHIVKVDGKVFRVPVGFADPKILSVFSFPLLAGRDDVLKDAGNIVLTRSRAVQLFGAWNVVGKTISIKMDTSWKLFTVAAVAEDIPANTSISFDILGSYEYLMANTDRGAAADNWHRTNGDATYVLLRPDSRLMNEPDRLRQFRLRHYPDEAADYRAKKKLTAAFVLHPLRDLHILTNMDDRGTTDPKNIWILLSIAGGIVLIASINFTTLAIARSARRAKEVGVRRVVGGLKRQLIVQFLTESVLLSVLSTILGCLLAYTLLPWFNQLAGRELDFSISRFPELIWMLCGSTLLVGLLAGSYPALVLSGFNPVDVLKTKIKLGGSNFFTRSLVTLQFVLSIGLIIGTIIILKQVSFMRHKDLGLIKENTIVVDASDANKEKSYLLFRQLLQSDRLIKGITASAVGLGEGQGEMGSMFDFDGKKTGVIQYPVDADFIPVMGVQLLAGRNFDPAITADTVSSIIVNEALVKNTLGLTPPETIGLRCKAGKDAYRTIIGVTKDFNFEPLNREVRPQAFMIDARYAPTSYFVHLSGGDPTQAIADVSAAWKKIAPEFPLRYSFLDENLDRFYKSEARWGSIVACAGGISIFLACLGLFGLAALAAANRVKEIGIRKILGASTVEIVRLLTGGFLRLVLLSALIASPMAWLVMNRWLRDFAYRIDIGWMVFAGTASMALVIAFVTIGLQAMRSARANPVGSLRSE
ncbi:MAG TPA: ABC transporter permease [Puia sp.]|nr:ABC transporter permease [Puia sp.]